MKLAFHLGRVYTLSLAEILAILNRRHVEYMIVELFTEILILDVAADLDIPSLQKRLGGTVKIMEIRDEVPRKKKTDYVNYTMQPYFTAQILQNKFLRSYSGKIQFGVSLYSLTPDINLRNQTKRVGMDIKKLLQDSGLSCRLVLPENNGIALPSVAVTNNHLLEKGAEIDLLISDEKIYIANTLTVQDFADYGRRDYQRPSRDMRIGMLPPKVAQIMINLAQYLPEERTRGAYILDPFVGSGTVLQEALLIGFKVLGSDISREVIEAAESNLNWFRNRYKLSPGRYKLEVSDVAHISEVFPGKEIVSVITEGTLGPAYDKPPDKKEMENNFKRLSKVYLSAFEQIKKILKPGRTMVTALPAYKLRSGYITFPAVDKILDLGYSIETPISEEIKSKYKFLKITPRNSIIYDRKDQVVVREIIIFKLK